METYLARQPILDKDMRVQAYQLFYRSEAADKQFNSNTDANTASSSVMLAIQNSGLRRMTSGRPAYINFTPDLVTKEISTIFTPETVIIELAHGFPPEPSFIRALRALKSRGYRIALNRFDRSAQFEPLLMLASIIKIDLHHFPPSELPELAAHAKQHGITLLAQKLETREDFDLAVSLGFDLFQGYFFSHPIIMQDTALNPCRFQFMNLMQLIFQQEPDYTKVSQVIRSDLALSFNLLRLVNSASMGTRLKIRDIPHAVAYLGTSELRKWVSLVNLGAIQEARPGELFVMSMIRAHFCEALARASRQTQLAEQFFLTGLFSLLDTLFCCKMDEVLTQLPLQTMVTQALVDHLGPGYQALEIIERLEKGDFQQVEVLSERLDLNERVISRLYFEGIIWAGSVIDGD